MVTSEKEEKFETGSVKEDNRKSYRIFLILFLISFGINLILLGLYLEKEVPWRSLLKERKEAREERQEKWAEGMVPAPVIHLKAQDHLLLCEKNTRMLHLIGSEPDRLFLIKSFPCTVGSNNGDKREVGDLATPEGIYFLISFLSGLPEKYGSGAFPLNYPNLLDRKEGKRGSGIWLHGFPSHLEPRASSEGCVVVQDDDFKELMKWIKIKDTPLIKLHLESKAFLLSQKDGGQIAVLRINQDYISDNFKSYTRKILYLREEQGQRN